MNSPRRSRCLALLSIPACVALAACGVGPSETGILHTGRTGDLSFAPALRGDSGAPIDAACGHPTAATPSAPATFFRRPHLQRMTERSVQIAWMSSEAGMSVAVTSPDGAAVTSVAAVADDSMPAMGGASSWLAAIQGLAPNTLYCYELSTGQGVTARAGFRTAPAAGQGAEVRFVAMGDTGARTIDQDAVYTEMRRVPFDLVLNAGDLAYGSGTPTEIQHVFFEPYAEMMQRFPVFPASGNHEYDSDDAIPFRQAFHLPENGGEAGIERWYSFDWGDVHFVALDTERTGPAQAAWLDSDLAANQLPWTIVFGHRPPFSSGSHGSDLAFQQYFLPVLEKHRVPLVITAHDHNYERTTPQKGIVHVVTGGGGVGVRPVGTSHFTAFSDAVAQFVYVTVSGNELKLRAIDGSGADFDSLLIRR